MTRQEFVIFQHSRLFNCDRDHCQSRVFGLCSTVRRPVIEKQRIAAKYERKLARFERLCSVGDACHTLPKRAQKKERVNKMSAKAKSKDPIPVLVADLDGTLLSTDMLFETFWARTAKEWSTPVKLIPKLAKGRAALKSELASEVDGMDLGTLPWRPEVIDALKAWRAKGGRTALVTASDQTIADAVAGHLGLFDDVHGSDGTTNLKADKKAAFLADTYKDTGFSYIGDSEADLLVWPEAKEALTAGAPYWVRGQAEHIGVPVTHLTTDGRAKTRDYIKALRPHQWLKNVLVFLPLLAAHDFRFETVLAALMAFIAFSVVASSVYLLNDLLDLAADRAHPRKRERPFARGAVPLSHGGFMAVGLLGLGLVISALINPLFLLVIAVYYALTMAYSFRLKRSPIVDICALSGLYTLRIIAGGAATGIELSIWLLAFSIFLFYALAAMKRQAELVDLAAREELSTKGRGYRVSDLPLVSQMAVGAGYVAVLVLALYLNSESVAALYTAPEALWGMCVVMLFWVSYLIMATHRGEMTDDPIIFAIRNRTSRIAIAIMGGFAIGAGFA